MTRKQNYQELISTPVGDVSTPNEPGYSGGPSAGASDLPPHQVLVHIPDRSSRWSHVDNLDDFFRRIYEYHQRGGALCMILSDAFDLCQFIFVVIVVTVLAECVDYPVLFHRKLARGHRLNDTTNPYQKVTLPEIFVPSCVSHFSTLTSICLFLAALFLILRGIRVFFLAVQYWTMWNFYTSALGIETKELVNLTWHQVQQKLCTVQAEQQLCIHKRELTELDIYQRILRWKNYLVSMVNKNLLPPSIHFPIVGETVVFTTSLKLNLEILLFWGPWAPWRSNWSLHPAYKKRDALPQLSRHLARCFTIAALVNLALSPFIFIWQLCAAFASYTDLARRQPEFFGSRLWSNYARYYLRHLNELDHELTARLNRAYRPAMAYLDLFTTPVTVVVARHVVFLAGGILAVILVLAAYDEDVMQVEHVITILTCMGIIIAVCRAFLPDENVIFCPEYLLNQVLAQVHYMPDTWRYQAHTTRVRQDFASYFQYKVVFLLEELVSPFVTPMILFFWCRPRAGSFVEFLHNYTIEVPELGDVCSFAQLDIRRHGHPKWQPESSPIATADKKGPQPGRKSSNPASEKPNGRVARDQTEVPLSDEPCHRLDEAAENGKVELSLLHFAMTNPGWNPSPTQAETQRFLHTFTGRGQRHNNMFDVVDGPLNAVAADLTSMLGGPLGGPLANNIGPTGSTTALYGVPSPFGNHLPTTSAFVGTGGMLTREGQMMDDDVTSPVRLVGSGMKKCEGPPPASAGLGSSSATAGLWSSSFQQSAYQTRGGVGDAATSKIGANSIIGDQDGNHASILLETGGQAPLELSINVLRLHEMHRQRLRGRSYGSSNYGMSGVTGGGRPTDVGSRQQHNRQQQQFMGSELSPYAEDDHLQVDSEEFQQATDDPASVYGARRSYLQQPSAALWDVPESPRRQPSDVERSQVPMLQRSAGSSSTSGSAIGTSTRLVLRPEMPTAAAANYGALGSPENTQRHPIIGPMYSSTQEDHDKPPTDFTTSPEHILHAQQSEPSRWPGVNPGFVADTDDDDDQPPLFFQS